MGGGGDERVYYCRRSLTRLLMASRVVSAALWYQASIQAKKTAQESDNAIKGMAVPIGSVRTDRLKVNKCNIYI